MHGAKELDAKSLRNALLLLLLPPIFCFFFLRLSPSAEERENQRWLEGMQGKLADLAKAFGPS